MDNDLKNYTLEELEQLMEELDQEKYLGRYIFSFIHSKGANNLSQITPVSKNLCSHLTNLGFFISCMKTIQILKDPDGTIKYLFELADGNRIESVLLFDKNRRTLCLSTQAGCSMGCIFCATAKLRLRRNLTAAEITDQVYLASAKKNRITNIVYMGMGEPLNNYECVIKSVRILNNPYGKNLGLRHITISTCGHPPGIKRLSAEDIHPRLAVSLNAPNNSIRTKLMPINSKYPLEDLLKAVKYYQIKTRLRVTFEYVLIRDINDSPSCAKILTKTVRGFNCNINLISYNPHPGCDLTPSSNKTIQEFAQILNRAGVKAIIRPTKGQKIKAACGQLGAAFIESQQPITPATGQR